MLDKKTSNQGRTYQPLPWRRQEARAAKRRSDEGHAKRQALYRTAEKLAKKICMDT